MDIVVTIPKVRQAEMEEEERLLRQRLDAGEKGLTLFWGTSMRPTKLMVGDRVYFVWDGAVRAYHILTGFRNDERCEHTGKRYKGCCLMLDPEVHSVEPEPMKGFRGFRYRYRRAGG